MEITEVRIKLMEEGGERLQAFCSITFDDSFVIRDLKIIEGTNGPFVAMPSRKLTGHCPSCGCKNHLRAGYCNQCGSRLKEDRFPKDEDGRAKLYADIAHPINSACREMIQDRVIREFHMEQERAKLPGYVSRYEDFDEDAVGTPASRSPVSHAPRSGSERTKFQPAEPRPAGPHKPASSHHPGMHSRTTGAHQSTSGSSTPAVPGSSGSSPVPPSPGPHAPPRDGFGVGIF